jgi:AraC-like DNA-binding protein
MFLTFALSVLSFIALLCCFQTLSSKNSNRLVTLLMSFWLFSRFFYAFGFYLEFTGFIIDIPYILLFFTPVYYAAPVCGYLFIKSLLNQRTKLRPIEYLHFIPAVLSIIEICISNFLSPVNYNQIARELVQTQNMAFIFDIGFLPPSFHFWVKNLIMAIYLGLSWDALFRSGLMKIKGWGNHKKLFLSLALTQISLFHLIIVFNSFSLNNVLFTIQQLHDSQTIVFFVVIITFGFIFFIANEWKLVFRYSIFEEKFIVITPKPKEFSKENPIEINSSPSDRESVFLLESIMLKEKFFLLPKHDLIIRSLAKASSLPVHKCSRLINIALGVSLPDWVNKFRIDYFIKSFPEKCSSKTIDAIALESGFTSRTTFYRAFKKEMGMMPSDYFFKN